MSESDNTVDNNDNSTDSVSLQFIIITTNMYNYISFLEILVSILKLEILIMWNKLFPSGKLDLSTNFFLTKTYTFTISQKDSR